MQKIPSLEAMVCNNKESNLQTNLHRKPAGPPGPTGPTETY